MAKKISKNKSKDKYALLSVYNKSGIVELAKTLQNSGYKIISTGGTAKVLSENNISIIPIQEITQNPESFDGRMKTISFQVESGILFDRNNPNHRKEAESLQIKPIDIVICNLYPFEETIKNAHVPIEQAIENIDVGGPTMVRSAAKNFQNVVVVVDPGDYELVEDAVKKNQITTDLRKELAAKAFSHLSFYDSQIAAYLQISAFPEELTLGVRKFKDLRYGENPHQNSALYLYPNNNSPLGNLKKQWGRDLSLTNVSDINAGLESVRVFNTSAAVIIKHNSPCGIALGATQEEALQRAIDSDPESAFGGVIITNQTVDIQTARRIGVFKDEKKANIDILACPSIDPDALEYLKTVRKSMGIYTFGNIPKIRKDTKNLKWVDGGFILQEGDNEIEKSFSKWEIVTKKKPTKNQLEQMQIAWKFISRIRSNAIIIIDKSLPMTRGIGSGQTSRLRSTKIALEQAKGHTKDAILASDSFFPFDDSVKLSAKEGITCIVQQGGSINDKASIETADNAGICMVFTGQRAFWH